MCWLAWLVGWTQGGWVDARPTAVLTERRVLCRVVVWVVVAPGPGWEEGAALWLARSGSSVCASAQMPEKRDCVSFVGPFAFLRPSGVCVCMYVDYVGMDTYTM